METPGTEHGQIVIRRSSLDDLPHLLAISQAATYSARWTEQQWRDIFSTQNSLRIAWMAWDLEGPRNSSDVAPNADSTPEAILSASPSPGQAAPDAAAPAAIGFLVALCGGSEWELENMAVLPALRRRGVGSALLATLLAEARTREAERILLEVRPSNLGAIRLYQSGGFALLARRPGYYREPVEDALVMVHVL